MNGHKAGLALAAISGMFHAVWALLVAAGWAQALLDFVLRLHFLSNPYTLSAFGFGRGAALILFTTATGYACGRLLALVWSLSRE